MTKAVTPNRWFLAWRARPPAADMDAADFGTAFGLELSMLPIEHDAPPVAKAVGRRPGWVRRLAARRKPVT